MAKPHYVTETQILRKVASDPECRYIWTKHAPKQMTARGYTEPDIECALMNGQVVLEERKKDILWRVEGTGIDGGKITVVVAVYAAERAIKVVTVF